MCSIHWPVNLWYTCVTGLDYNMCNTHTHTENESDKKFILNIFDILNCTKYLQNCMVWRRRNDNYILINEGVCKRFQGHLNFFYENMVFLTWFNPLDHLCSRKYQARIIENWILPKILYFILFSVHKIWNISLCTLFTFR